MTTATTAQTGAVSAPSTLAGSGNAAFPERQQSPGGSVPSSPVRPTAPHGTSVPDASSLASGAAFLDEPRPLWWQGRVSPSHRGYAVHSPALDGAAEARVLALLAEGVPCHLIAHRLRCAFVLVAEVAFRHGVEPAWDDPEDAKTPRRSWAERARELHAAGKTGTQIANALGRSYRDVYRWARAEGVEIVRKRSDRMMTPARAALARKLAPTHSIPEAAPLIGVGRETLRSWANRNPDARFVAGSATEAFKAQARARFEAVRAHRWASRPDLAQNTPGSPLPAGGTLPGRGFPVERATKNNAGRAGAGTE